MEPRRSSDIDLLTLAIAAVASAAAAYITSQVWAGGTLVSAALTPVIVALVKEGLNRPVSRVTTLRSERRTVEHVAPDVPAPPDPPGTRRWWKVGLVSGLAAFALVLAVFTVPELVAGKSIGRSGDSATTFFGGHKRSSKPKRRSPSATAAPTEPGQERTPEATATPEETVTTEPTVTPTVAPTVTAAPTAASATPVP